MSLRPRKFQTKTKMLLMSLDTMKYRWRRLVKRYISPIVSSSPTTEMAINTAISPAGPTVESTDLKAKYFVSRKLQVMPTAKEQAAAGK